MVWRSLFRGFVQVHILHHASQHPVYGTWLIEELAHHGYALSPGTLYPILHRLEEDGMLRSTEEVVEGKRRRYYTITPAGAEALAQARRQALELVGEIAEDVGEIAGEPAPQTAGRDPGGQEVEGR
jgi:PadR family transcriptional regulator PadR